MDTVVTFSEKNIVYDICRQNFQNEYVLMFTECFSKSSLFTILNYSQVIFTFLMFGMNEVFSVVLQLKLLSQKAIIVAKADTNALTGIWY